MNIRLAAPFPSNQLHTTLSLDLYNELLGVCLDPRVDDYSPYSVLM